MPIDARISMGLRPQTYDAFAAYDTGRQNEQTFRTNQMAQQAAQATAELNRNAMNDAALLDPNDRAAQQRYALRYGAAGTPFLTALSGVDTNFAGRGTERRAEGEFDIKQNEAGMTELRTVVGRVFNNPDDASLADAAQRYPQFAADINRIAANPDAAARRTGLATLVASLPGGPDFLDAVTQEYGETDLGGSIRITPKRTYLPGETQTLATTADPRAPTIIQTSQGYGQLNADGTFTPATDAQGNPVMPYQAPRAGAGADEPARAAAAATLTDVLYQLDENFETLYRQGFMRGEGVTGIGNMAQFARDKVPFLRGIQLAGNPAADAAAGSIEALLSTAVSTLSSLYGTSSRVMDAVKEMENVRKSFGSQDIPIEAVRSVIQTVFRRVAEEEFARTGTRPEPPPERGTVRDGYRYRGGNPANETSWTPVR
jgi:hypothetical protein